MPIHTVPQLLLAVCFVIVVTLMILGSALVVTLLSKLQATNIEEVFLATSQWNKPSASSSITFRSWPMSLNARNFTIQTSEHEISMSYEKRVDGSVVVMKIASTNRVAWILTFVSSSLIHAKKRLYPNLQWEVSTSAISVVDFRRCTPLIKDIESMLASTQVTEERRTA